MTPKFQTVPAAALEPPSEEERGFETYLHYLQSLNSLCFLDGPIRLPHAAIASACCSSDAYRRIQRKTSADLDRVKRLLRNAWATEVGLRLSREIGDDLVRYANHWAPVQAYYAVYLQAQAYFAACAKPVTPDHAATLQTLSDDLRSGRLSAPAPWSVLCISELECGRAGFMNLPAEAQLLGLSTLSIPDPTRYWSFYGLMLRTTRARLQDTRASEWKRRNKKDDQPRKRIPAAERAKLDSRLHGTSLFDFLYRLRIRSNYRDADTLLEGTSGDQSAKVFNEALLNIADTTALIFEAHIRRHAGAEFYDETAERFMGISNALSEAPVAQRLEILRAQQ